MAQVAGIGPGRRARVAALPRYSGGRHGRDWLTGGTGRPRGMVGSNGVRGERDSVTRS
jgi:hypothetical protein